MSQKFWVGYAPAKCDMRDEPITDTFIDGKTRFGAWGNMCPACFRNYGVGLGTGRGQKYEKQADGRWLKVGG